MRCCTASVTQPQIRPSKVLFNVRVWCRVKAGFEPGSGPSNQIPGPLETSGLRLASTEPWSGLHKVWKLSMFSTVCWVIRWVRPIKLRPVRPIRLLVLLPVSALAFMVNEGDRMLYRYIKPDFQGTFRGWDRSNVTVTANVTVTRLCGASVWLKVFYENSSSSVPRNCLLIPKDYNLNNKINK